MESKVAKDVKLTVGYIVDKPTTAGDKKLNPSAALSKVALELDLLSVGLLLFLVRKKSSVERTRAAQAAVHRVAAHDGAVGMVLEVVRMHRIQQRMRRCDVVGLTLIKRSARLQHRAKHHKRGGNRTEAKQQAPARVCAHVALTEN